MARYYPNGSNKKRTPKEEEQQQEMNYDFVHNPVTNWWDSNFHSAEDIWNGNIKNERDYYIASMLMGIPGVNGLLKAHWGSSQLQNYMDMYGLGWSDLNAFNLFNGQFGNQGLFNSFRNSTHFVSDMVKELYS